MSIDNSGNNAEIQTLFDILCRISIGASKDADGNFAQQVIRLIKIAYDSQLNQVGENIEISYKDLTDLVYDNEEMFLPPSDTLDNFRKRVEERIITDDYCQKADDPSLCHKHFMSCYDKIIRHIHLAETQREYIKKEVKKAESIAKDAKNTSNLAKKTAGEAQEIAKDAKAIYDTMFTNYVTILGVFTAIIVTIFGGLNVVDTIVSYGDTHFSTIVFLAALVLMCVVCLLYFLAKIILRLNGKDEADQRFTLESLFGVIFGICLTLALIAWCANPDKETPEQPKETSEQTK